MIATFAPLFQGAPAGSRRTARWQTACGQLLIGLLALTAGSPAPGAPDDQVSGFAFDSLPSTVEAKARSTGLTTGHIGDVTLHNRGARPVRIDPGALMLPPTGGYQGYFCFPGRSVVVGAGQTARIPLADCLCTDVHRAPVPAGQPLVPPTQWIGVDPQARQEISDPDWKPAVGTGFEPVRPGSSAPGEGPAYRAAIPGTERGLGHRIDYNAHPEAAAPLLAEAARRIREAYQEAAHQGRIVTPFSRDRERERQAVEQQTFWIFAGALSGEDYDKEDFRVRLEEQHRANTGRSIQEAPPAHQQQFEKGVDAFWGSFELVGRQAKVIQPASEVEAVPVQQPAQPVRRRPPRLLLPAVTVPGDCDWKAAEQRTLMQLSVSVRNHVRGMPAASPCRDRFRALADALAAVSGARTEAELEQVQRRLMEALLDVLNECHQGLGFRSRQLLTRLYDRLDHCLRPHPGFVSDPANPDQLIPDETELGPGDAIGPRAFTPSPLDERQYGPHDPARWQQREAPEKLRVSPTTTAWIQKHGVQSLADGKRGGEYVVHFKYRGPCEPGRWRQLVRETVYVGASANDLLVAELVDGRYVPKDPQPDEPAESSAWEVDTNAAGRAAGDPDYPHQARGEMYDSPDRRSGDLRGHYRTRDPGPGGKRTPAAVIVKDVEFITYFVGPDGEVCDLFRWGFRVSWSRRNPNDPSPDPAVVSTDFDEPRRLSPDSDQGRDAIDAYRAALRNFP